MLPLGGRCVLLTTISHVDLPRVLREVDPELARKADDPHAMLLPREKWPPKLSKQFRYLAASYGQMVDKGLENKMMRMMPRRKIEKAHGTVLVSGGFAVPKNAAEDRFVVSFGSERVVGSRTFAFTCVSVPSRPAVATCTSRWCACLSVSGTRATTIIAAGLVDDGARGWRSLHPRCATP